MRGEYGLRAYSRQRKIDILTYKEKKMSYWEILIMSGEKKKSTPCWERPFQREGKKGSL